MAGFVYINNGNVDNGDAKLLVSGSDGNSCSALFYHPNRSQGIGIAYDGLVALGYTTNQNISMRPRGTGWFQVVACSGSSGYQYFRYFNYDVQITSAYTYKIDVCARFYSSIWCSSWIASSSDIRIKEDIQDINDNNALEMILAIEPKTYKYIDKVAKGNKKVYGFIAQQIKEVIPEAISIQNDYIPNIMLLADYDNEIITLPSQPTKVIIKLNDKIRCYGNDNIGVDVEIIEIIDELTFKIRHNNQNKDYKYTDNKIFVSGTEVDDFHTISKEYIFTLNVCATQELHRRIEAQKVIIQSQEDRIKELETKVERLLNYISL